MLATRASTAALSGLKPRASNITEVTATGAPNPASASSSHRIQAIIIAFSFGADRRSRGRDVGVSNAVVVATGLAGCRRCSRWCPHYWKSPPSGRIAALVDPRIPVSPRQLRPPPIELLLPPFSMQCVRTPFRAPLVRCRLSKGRSRFTGEFYPEFEISNLKFACSGARPAATAGRVSCSEPAPPERKP